MRLVAQFIRIPVKKEGVSRWRRGRSPRATLGVEAHADTESFFNFVILQGDFSSFSTGVEKVVEMTSTVVKIWGNRRRAKRAAPRPYNPM